MELGITTEPDNDLIKTQLPPKKVPRSPPITKCLRPAASPSPAFALSFNERQAADYDISGESHILHFNRAAMNLVQRFHLQCKYIPVIVHQASISKCLLHSSTALIFHIVNKSRL